MFEKITRAALLALLAFAACPLALPAAAQDDDEPRRDVTIGNPDRMRSGPNERGDNEMVIERKPKTQQEMPDIGPIYVIPEVNNQRGVQRAPLPGVPPGSPGYAPPGPVRQQPGPGPGTPRTPPARP